MKILVLGDLHGQTIWKPIIEKEKPDKIIMLGDYFDSFDITVAQQISNFEEILKYKKVFGSDKFILCLGNHDYHYFYNASYSGFKESTRFMMKDILQKAYENGTIVPLHIEDNIIFSHAGVSKYWLKNVSNIHKVEEINSQSLDIHTLDWNSIKGFDPYGGTISNSPIWIRPWALKTNMLAKYIQVVGHTHTKEIMKEGRLYSIDTLPKEYLVIEDGKFIIKKAQE